MIDSSIVATSLYTIGNDFKSMETVNWVALSYTLAYLSCGVTFSRISDIVGRRNAFLAGYTLFLAFSLGCALAQNLSQLIAFRALQGMGGSGLYALSMIILPELCPPHLTQFIGSMVGVVVAGAGVLGPVLGGILTHYASWRWVFAINIPIGVISIIIFFLSWPKEEHLPTYERRTWKEFDLIGSILVIGAAVIMVFAFQHAGESKEDTWNKPAFIAPLIGGVACWILLLTWEWIVTYRLGDRIAPTFPVGLFRNRVYSAGALSTLFLGFPFLLLIFSFPLRAQVVSGKSPLISGLMLLPMLGTSALGTMVAGKFNMKKNYLVETLCCGACLMTVGCGLLIMVRPGDDAKALGFLAFAGLGFGLATSSATILANFEAPIRDYAPAQGILGQLRMLGGSLGIAMSTEFVKDQSKKHLAGLLTPEQMGGLSREGSTLTAVQRRAVQLAYSNAFRDGMIVAAAISGAGIFLTLLGYRRVRQIPSEQRAALIREETARRAAKTCPQVGSVSTVEA